MATITVAFSPQFRSEVKNVKDDKIFCPQYEQNNIKDACRRCGVMQNQIIRKTFDLEAELWCIEYSRA